MAEDASNKKVRLARRGRPPIGKHVQRARILSAAADIFTAHQFDAVSLDAIAQAAGVTKRTIYDTVGDKAALFRAVCNDSAASVSHMTFPHLTAGVHLLDALMVLSRTLLKHALEPSRVALSRMIIGASSHFPELVREVLNVGRQHMQRGIIATFENIEHLGIATVPNHEVAAEIFYDIVVGNQAFRATIGFDERAISDELLTERLKVFVRGFVERDDRA